MTCSRYRLSIELLPPLHNHHHHHHHYSRHHHIIIMTIISYGQLQMSVLSKSTKPTDDKFNSLSFLTKLTKSLLHSREKSNICAVFVTFVVFDRLSVANFPSVSTVFMIHCTIFVEPLVVHACTKKYGPKVAHNVLISALNDTVLLFRVSCGEWMLAWSVCMSSGVPNQPKCWNLHPAASSSWEIVHRSSPGCGCSPYHPVGGLDPRKSYTGKVSDRKTCRFCRFWHPGSNLTKNDRKLTTNFPSVNTEVALGN